MYASPFYCCGVTLRLIFIPVVGLNGKDGGYVNPFRTLSIFTLLLKRRDSSRVWDAERANRAGVPLTAQCLSVFPDNQRFRSPSLSLSPFNLTVTSVQ